MNHFTLLTPQALQTLVSRREGETKLGENVVLPESENWENSLAKSPCKYVLLCIPEDIGVKANFGIGGTPSVAFPALKAILNVQETSNMQGKDLLVLGYFDFSEWTKDSEGKPVAELRKLVAKIDDEVYPLIEKIVRGGKTPIVIGGGHNNAYPIIKGVSKAKNKKINCINLDAHSDYRIMEGRHSGNGFRYAKHEGFLHKYVPLGLHENYNSALVMNTILEDAAIKHFSFEEMFIYNTLSFEAALKEATQFLKDEAVGIELDLDAIANTLSSAATPCGITAIQARQYIVYMTSHTQAAYLHLPEGATQLEDGRSSFLTPKLIAYLVADFIKTMNKKAATTA